MVSILWSGGKSSGLRWKPQKEVPSPLESIGKKGSYPNHPQEKSAANDKVVEVRTTYQQVRGQEISEKRQKEPEKGGEGLLIIKGEDKSVGRPVGKEHIQVAEKNTK